MAAAASQGAALDSSRLHSSPFLGQLRDQGGVAGSAEAASAQPVISSFLAPGRRRTRGCLLSGTLLKPHSPPGRGGGHQLLFVGVHLQMNTVARVAPHAHSRRDATCAQREKGGERKEPGGV